MPIHNGDLQCWAEGKRTLLHIGGQRKEGMKNIHLYWYLEEGYFSIGSQDTGRKNRLLHRCSVCRITSPSIGGHWDDMNTPLHWQEDFSLNLMEVCKRMLCYIGYCGGKKALSE